MPNASNGAGGVNAAGNGRLDSNGDYAIYINGGALFGHGANKLFTLRVYNDGNYNSGTPMEEATVGWTYGQYAACPPPLPPRDYKFVPVPIVTVADGENPANGGVTFDYRIGLTINGAAVPSTTCIPGSTVRFTAYKRPVSGGPPTLFTTVEDPAGRAVCGEETMASGVLGTTYHHTPTAGSFQAGDQFCLDMYVTPYKGQIDSAGNVVPGSTTDANTPGDPDPDGAIKTTCVPIHNKPIFKAYGKGVSAGGDFAPGTCTGGGILSSWYNSSGQRGSGTDLSAIALASIIGFSSARSNPAAAPTGLSFANAGLLPGVDITTDPLSPRLGGKFNHLDPATRHCISLPEPPDDVVSTAASTIQLDSTSVPGRDPVKVSGNLYLNPSGPSVSSPGNDTALFVNGDVIIFHNITYNTAGWNETNIPSFVLKSEGNIYIDPRVTRLDGLYSAKGKIFTCSQGTTNFALMTKNDLYAHCRNRLVVNGAFQAKQVNLMRTFGSLRDNPNPSSSNCSNAGSGTTPKQTCAAEVFNFSPEMYLGNPAIKKPNNSAPIWDAITSLPPVL